MSSPEDLPDDEKRHPIDNQAENKLSRHEEEACFNDHLRELYYNVNKATGRNLDSTDDLIYALARFASRDLKEKLIGQPGTIYPWQKPKQ